MGVEYEHGVFVADTNWVPTWKHVEAIDAVLQKFGFRRQEPPFYSTKGSNWEPIDESEAREMPDNFALAYETVEGDAAEAIMGPSAYEDIASEDRYIMNTMLVFGTDYIQNEGHEVEVTTDLDGDWADNFHMTFLIPAPRDAKRPTTDAAKGFDHVWRCGILLDCHKDVPDFGEKAGTLPNRKLVEALEKAFGTKLVEYGWIY